MSSFVIIHRQLIFAKCLNQTDDTWQVYINTVVKNVIYRSFRVSCKQYRSNNNYHNALPVEMLHNIATLAVAKLAGQFGHAKQILKSYCHGLSSFATSSYNADDMSPSFLTCT